MAIFERNRQQNNILDDSVAISITVESSQEVSGHTEYLLRVQRGPNKENSWKILRRYNDFAELHKCLIISGIELPMPGKKFFGNMRPDFIAKRREALQIYINAVLMNPILASSLPAKRFVDPDSYSQSFHDQAVQNASLCLRNECTSIHWALGTTLGAIGWRLRKHFFKVTTKPPEKSSNKLVKTGSQSHQQGKHLATASSNNGGTGGGSLDSGLVDASELVLEWLEYGPDKYVDEKEMSGILKSLMALQHPYIEPIVAAAHNENGGLVIRRFYKHGTLKDKLCMATPKNPFLSKYGNPKGRCALTMKQVATYGRQILEALIYLHSKGYPYGHLHSGNIVIADDVVKLLDIENYIFGVPSFYRPFFVQHSKIHMSEAIEVYCFGHVLFEMSMGYPLQESVVRQINDFPEALKNLLESILSKEACRAGLPTLEQLINHEFFIQHASVTARDTKVDAAATTSAASTSSDELCKPHFKLSLNAKELLKQAMTKAENRLRDEQKSVKNQKRIVRVQELMSSEEEKRKTKQKAKLEHKQSKLKQQVSLQTNNGRLTLCSTSMGTSSSQTNTPTVTSAGVSGTVGNVNPFMRTDSVLSVNVKQDANNAAAFSGVKSPPLTPSAQQQQQQQQQQYHHHHHYHHHYHQQEQQQQQQHHSTIQQLKQTSSGAHTVERQSSSPNITAADHQASEEDNSEPTRSALLESICKFNRGSLRKVRSND